MRGIELRRLIQIVRWCLLKDGLLCSCLADLMVRCLYFRVRPLESDSIAFTLPPYINIIIQSLNYVYRAADLRKNFEWEGCLR